ncbi:MAG: P-loop NTPase [DPANN group archaeon]|nr:P-loop NTPase [DPANN group archaeon]
MSRVISVISGKGGVGKTTLVSNLVVALSHLDKRVAVIDANITGANLSVHLGLVQYDNSLNDVLDGSIDLSGAMYRHGSGVDIIPASLTRLDGDMSGFKNVISNLVGYYDYVIIDVAAGIESEVYAAVSCSDAVMLVTTPELTAVSNVALALRLCHNMSKTVLGVVINQIHGDSFEIKSDAIGSFLDVPIIARIEDHKHVRESIAVGMPVVDYSPLSQPAKVISDIAQNLIEY